MANAEEDFTFPATTATPLPCFFESPPLWQPVPRPERPESLQYGIGLGKFIKLCSCQECKARNKITLRESFRYDDNGGTEEKMDLLWEDLDEKSSRNRGRTDEENDENSSSPGKNERVCLLASIV